MPRGRDSRAAEAARQVELIGRTGAGQEDAFTELYDETSPRVYGAALAMLRSPRAAAEVTQEAYVEIWQQASRYDPNKGSVGGWMMSVVHSRCMDRLRAITKESPVERYATVNGDQEFDHGSEQIGESRLDVERARHALSSLPDIQRQAVTLAYFNGYSQTEVARLLGLPLGTVKSGIRDGLVGLRDALGVGT